MVSREKILERLLKAPYEEPVFFINFIKVNRKFEPIDQPQLTIEKGTLTRWKVQGENLSEPTEKEDKICMFFSGESYIIKCNFLIYEDGISKQESLLFYWRGEHASKGHSPLPSDVDEDHPMERYWQWCESALFFNCFPQNLVVFSAAEKNFNKNKPHLLMLRGKINNEVHLCEVPCEYKSLRSRASFILVCPKQKHFIYWHGLNPGHTLNNNMHLILEKYVRSWKNFKVSHSIQNEEEGLFSDILDGTNSNYISETSELTEYNPRMFYLNSISGKFDATEVHYPLRNAASTDAYPFLQTHLSIPGIFLIDFDTDVWLWVGEPKNDEDMNNDSFKKDLQSSIEFAELYAKNKSTREDIPVSVKQVIAGEEPLEFKNIFPVWN